MTYLTDLHNNETQAVFNFLQLRIRQLTEVNRMLAHNLRGAAANIHMLIDALEELDKNDDPSEAAFTKEEINTYIRESCDGMIATMEKMMDSAKTDMEQVANMEVCDVQEAVENVCKQMSYLLLSTHASVDLYLEQKEIVYSKVYLDSILYNLISNATKHAQPGRLLQISIYMYMKDGKPVLEVSDNGEGMDMEVQHDKLFRPFHSTETTGVHGLGLYLVKTQIESLGGEIRVQSQPGAGTSFSMTL